MTERRLRFSERKKLAETGSLGDLDEGASNTVRSAIWLYLQHACARANGDVKSAFDAAFADALGRHFGNSDLGPVAEFGPCGRPQPELATGWRTA